MGTVKPQQRIAEFSGEQLIVSNSKLFRQACREELNLKMSSVKNHVQSAPLALKSFEIVDAVLDLVENGA